MNKALNSVSAFILLFANGIKRFYTSFCFTLIIFGVWSYLIIGENISKDATNLLERIILVPVLGFLISVFFTVVAEKYNNSKLIKLINVITSITVPVLYFFVILTDLKNKYQLSTLVGISIALIFMAVYFTNKTNNEDFSVHFSYLVKNVFIAAIVSLIVMLGLFLCTAAVYFLIYEFRNAYKIYFAIASFCWVVLFANLFLSMLAKNEEDYKIPKFFKVITLYTALPVYLGLVLILYIYLAKIIAMRSFPSGQLNWFASFASLIGIFLFLVLRQYYNSNSFVKWFIKLFGYILLPIIFMQCIAYNIRFLSYGLTSPRYISIVLIGISIITAIVSLIKSGKFVPYILFLLALCSLITTTGFLNLYDVPIYEQESRIIRVLNDNSMLDNNKIIPRFDIDEQSKIKITSAYNYIENNDLHKSKLLKETESQSFKQIFGFDKAFEKSEDAQNVNIDTYLEYRSQTQEIQIVGYSSLLDFGNNSKFEKEVNNNVLTIKNNNKEYIFDLNNFIKDLYKKQGVTNTIPQDELVIEQEDKKLVIKNISFNVNNDNNEVIVNFIDGYLLVK